MKPALFCLTISCTLLCADLPAQMLVVDHGIRREAAAALTPVGRTNGTGFVGDHFRIGAPGEVWIIDTIRVWTRSGESTGTSGKLGEIFESVKLFGGIEAAPPQPGQPPQPECDCHNLMIIRNARFQRGSDQFDTADVVVAPASDLHRVDFQNLHWSVPGGIDLQYGVMGAVRKGAQIWTLEATATTEPHALKVFDDKGKLEGPYTAENDGIGFNVQVFAHKSATVSIRSASAFLEVALHSEKSFDAAKTDPSTLRLGPRNAAAIDTHIGTVDGHSALIARFRRADTGIPGGVVSVCLTGHQQDGVPFEGCDLISSK